MPNKPTRGSRTAKNKSAKGMNGKKPAKKQGAKKVAFGSGAYMKDRKRSGKA